MLICLVWQAKCTLIRKTWFGGEKPGLRFDKPDFAPIKQVFLTKSRFFNSKTRFFSAKPGFSLLYLVLLQNL